MRLITVSHLQEIIRQTGLERFFQLTIEQLGAFSRWDEFDKSPRLAIHYPHGVIELMPCSDRQYYSVKYVNGHPGNTARGRLSIAALGLLAEVESGLPILLNEMTLLTAIRTAATGALSAQYMAQPESSRLALIGTGAQAEFQLLALQQALPIAEVRYFDSDPKAMTKFARNMAGRCELVQGLKPGRISATELTLFDPVDFAIEDYAVLRLVHQLASDLKFGDEVELLPSTDDPKDLYRLLVLFQGDID